MHFAVAVELIAENVVQQQDTRSDMLQRSRHGGLIDFEQADVPARVGAPVGALRDRGEQTGEQVRARAVVNRSQTRTAQDM